MNCDKLFTVDTMNGEFPVSVCIHCKREWETTRFESEFECEDCVEKLYPPSDGEESRDRDWE